MAINPEAMRAHNFADIAQEYVERDAILYSLGVGLCENPHNQAELKFLRKPNLTVLPSMAVTLGTLGMWVQDEKFGINVSKLVHARQSAIFQNPPPARANIIASAEIKSLADRGHDKGAVLTLDRHIRDAGSGIPYCSLTQTLRLRGDGGFGGTPPERSLTPTPPARQPDDEVAFRISPRAALIYQLSGDWNPLHTDPDMAQRSGFQKPILHGLASYGIAGCVILKTYCGADPERLQQLSC